MEENDFSKSFFIKSILLTIVITALIASMVTIIIINNTENSNLINPLC